MKCTAEWARAVVWTMMLPISQCDGLLCTSPPQTTTAMQLQLDNKLRTHAAYVAKIGAVSPHHGARAALRRCTPSSSSSSSSSHHEGEREHLLRMQLGQQFPNALLLEASRLPLLYNSKHFLNLTNGLEMAPLLQQLQLQFSVVRIRSTNLEQQAFESLMLELDANLLLALALGHRNRSDGAPRALWYGVTFIRYALHRFWLGYGGAAYLRGHNVSDTFEQACRRFHPSTKSRLRYYKRYLTPLVQQHGVQLAGVFKRTERDEDVEFFVDQAWQYCGVETLKAAQAGATRAGRHNACPSAASGALDDACKPQCEPHAGYAEHSQEAAVGPGIDEVPAAVRAVSLQSFGVGGGLTGIATTEHWPDGQLKAADLDAYEMLLSHGVGVFTAGISHTDFGLLKGSEVTGDAYA